MLEDVICEHRITIRWYKHLGRLLRLFRWLPVLQSLGVPRHLRTSRQPEVTGWDASTDREEDVVRLLIWPQPRDNGELTCRFQDNRFDLGDLVQTYEALDLSQDASSDRTNAHHVVAE